jgi:hypothetical protein
VPCGRSSCALSHCEPWLLCQRPTLIAFYPAWAIARDSPALQAFLDRAKRAAGEAGWAFEERYAGSLRIAEPGSQARYTLPVLPDSMGFVLAAPVRWPQLLDDKHAGRGLEAKLEALRAWLPGAAGDSHVRL